MISAPVASWTPAAGNHDQTVPVFTVIRSAKEEPDCAPAASPRVRCRHSPWPPGPAHPHGPEVPAASIHSGTHRARPASARFEPASALRGVTAPVPRVLLSGPLTSHTPSGSANAPWLCQDCSRQPRRLPGPAVLSSYPAAATARRWWSFTSTRISSTSRRTKPALNAFAITFGDRFPAAETY